MTRSQLTGMVLFTSILLALVSLLALMGWLQATGYEEANRKHCKQYEIYPEEHIDKVPPACQPQWFEVNKHGAN